MAIRKTRPEKPKKIPRFKSSEEEAEFWDSHSPLDYGEWEEEELEAARSLAHVLAVRLDGRTVKRLAATARKKGLGASTLARMWLLERLEQEKPT